MSSAESMATAAPSRPPAAARRALAWLGRILGGDNPVTSREIRTLARMRSVTVGTVLLPLLCTGLVVAVALDVLFGTNTYANPSDRGPVLLEVGSYAGLFLLSLLGSVLGAQAVGGERQARTLEPLLLTGMSPWRIVVGKTLGVWTILALVVLACLPPMGICFLLGGVSLPQLLAAAGLLLVVSLVPVSFGVLLGAGLRSPRLAVGLAVVLVALAGPLSVVPTLILGAVLVRGHDPSLLWWADAMLRDGATSAVLLGAVAAPLFAVVSPVWLFLAGAVSSLTPEGGDGSRPLKWWLLFTAPVGAALLASLGRVADAGPEQTVGLYGLLGLYLLVGTVAVTGHPASRARRTGVVGRLLGRGPVGGAAFATAVSALAVLAACAVDLTSRAPGAAAMAGAAIFAFVALLAGSSVFLSAFVPPRIGRPILVGVAVLTLLAPLAVALSLTVAGGVWGVGEAAVAAELSPLGAVIRIADEARTVGDPTPPYFAILWLAAGGAFAWGGHALRRVREKSRAQAGEPTTR